MIAKKDSSLNCLIERIFVIYEYTSLGTQIQLYDLRSNTKMSPKKIDKKLTDPKFKSFKDTYPHCAFALALALIYPNRKNFRNRMICIFAVIVLNTPNLLWFSMYLFKCLRILDMFNLARNITIGVLICIFFFKSFYVNYKNDLFGELLGKISEDLLKGNDMAEDYQEIYEQYIQLGKFSEALWIIIPMFLSSQFPIYAAVTMIIESVKSDTGTRYMVHEMDLKYIEDIQYESPYFEVLWAYNLLPCIVLMLNFVGFDGSFCIATTHLRLKLKLMSHKLYRAFKDSSNRNELEAKVKDVIKDHQGSLQFYNHLQNLYGGWLLVVFLLTSLIISMNVYQIYLCQQIHPKYTIFAVSGMIHMFAPCYFSSKLEKAGEDFSASIYCVAWEKWADPSVTKLLIFMIAKSQQPLILTGKGMVYINMQLFVSVLQTSYSFFTLISS
ncbi:unnamed protein product [Parnassius mnemosyne]|uniref:Odorant receptor n=1 Tax=Parnassius mnemosyne TaxID=213953 RepID=A0AAV1KH98_9NEOP